MNSNETFTQGELQENTEEAEMEIFTPLTQGCPLI